MYEDHFDPVEEPSTLDTDELLTRAYALGVAASMGRRHPDELARIVAGTDGAYERNLIEVAHQEGKQEARDVAADADDDGPSPWSVLVTEEASPAGEVDADGDSGSAERDGPERRHAVEGPPKAVERLKAMELPDRDPEMTDLPDFL